MRAPAFVVLVAGLVFAPGASPGLAASADATPGERLAAALQAALQAEDAARLRPLLPAGGPVAGWIAARWRTRLAPGDRRTWQVSMAPFYVGPTAMGGLLSLSHEAPGQPVERASFGVEAWARAQGWVVGDPLPLEQAEVEVERETLHLDLREASRLRGEARLALRRGGPERRLFLRLDPAAQLMGASLDGRPLEARQQGTWAYVGLPTQGASLTVEVRWEAGVPRPEAARRVRRWAPETPWYPQLAGRTPHPLAVLAMAPPGWAAVAPGAVGETTRYPDGWLYRYEGRFAPGDVPLWLGDWPNLSLSEGQPRIEAWSGPEVASEAARAVQEAGAVADQLGRLLGGFPLQRLVLGEGAAPDRVGRAGLWLLDPDSFRSEPQRAWLLPRAVTASCVLARPVDGTAGEVAWLQAALPAYLAALVAGRRDGPVGLRTALLDAYRRYDALAGQAGDQPIARAVPGGDEENWRRLTEDKGMLVWHMLARTVGPEAFGRALGTLLGPQAEGPLQVVAVQRACERAGAKPLGPFFRQWLGRPGRPRLALQGLSVARDGQGWAVRGRLVQEGEPFSLTVPLVMATAAAPRLYEVPVTAGSVGFVLKTPHRPTGLRIDPLHDTPAASAGAVALER